MKYMGSKARHAKEILKIVLKDRKDGQWYVEPFVGGANMIDKVGGHRIGSDIHYYLMEMWKAVSKGWNPPSVVITEEIYKSIKDNKDNYDAPLVGYVGFAMSYGGKWFGGYRRDVAGCQTNSETKRANELEQNRKSRNAAIKQNKNLFGVDFYCTEYWNLNIPDNSIIYCDPPYAGTTKYSNDFDHNRFWEWCESMVESGHTVYVSEYAAPAGWSCVWEKKVNNTLTKDTGSKQGTEKLFTYTKRE